ncbi:ATP-binding protein [Streptomyces sp. NRRL F-2799]|uniref:ATP-binding protein n=1 Tax=Streptomyces sp. NRRL F-2799 TaxID=1463844 RepID=UPI00068A1E6C|nr:ATP-binding protein [Streptomyces sp. NRRL F-2799]
MASKLTDEAPDASQALPPATERQRTVLFPRRRTTPRMARDFVVTTLTEWGETSRLDDMRLCASELVTNAVLHGAPAGRLVLVRVGSLADHLLIEVHDAGDDALRVPCPHPGCGWAEKHAERTRVRVADSESAEVSAVCLHHGAYTVTIRPAAGAYLDLATLYRNLVKELALTSPHGILHVMVKGGDWVFGSHLVDEALQAVGLTRAQLPARLFCPQVVTDTGAKLSKSLIGEGRAPLPEGAAPWMLDTRQWPGTITEYADQLLAMGETLLSDPRHFFRSYSAAEIGRLLTASPPRSVPFR